MPTVVDFLDEVNHLFGFYFDADMAFHLTKLRLGEMQMTLGLNDASSFSYTEGTPTGGLADFQKSMHRTNFGALKQRMAKGGTNSQTAAQAMVVFTFHIWEEKFRNCLTTNGGTPISDTDSDVMGDIRLLRNSIIHNKGIADASVGRCKVLKHFKPGQPIRFTDEIIYDIIKAIRQEFASRA